MTEKTLIGFQNSTDNKITVLELCSDSGQLNITGKVLNNLYNNISSVKQLIKEGTNPYTTGRIDVSNIVNIDNYTWGVAGTDLGIGYKEYDISSYLKQFSNSWYQYLYMFSETDNEWLVASRDNQTFRSLASEL
tara:strand:+ start:79 stop:480 length:402 start_codon:yes stop_codon:yes gene_type:complete